MKKIKDLAVKTGSYEKNGETKNRYKNIGAIFKKDDGSEFMFIDRSFNPAGVPFKEGSESIIVSMFDPKDKDGDATTEQSQHSKEKANGYQKQEDTTDIPF